MDRIQKREEEIKVTMAIMVDILLTMLVILSGMASIRPEIVLMLRLITFMLPARAVQLKWQLYYVIYNFLP